MRVSPAATQGFFQKTSFILEPVIEGAREFLVKKPIAATGGGVTFAGFIASLFFKDGIKFFPIVGIPVIGAFIYEIFCNNKKTNQNPISDPIDSFEFSPVSELVSEEELAFA